MNHMKMDWSYVGAVVVSGLGIVFLALILLIIAVSVMGRIFQAKKAPKKEEIPVQNAPAPVQAQTVESSSVCYDDEEIIAVISAAVAAMSAAGGKQLRIHSIKRRGASDGNAWARAARSENAGTF